MSNSLAVAIVLALGALLAADLLVLGWDLHIRIGRLLVGLIETMAIWR